MSISMPYWGPKPPRISMWTTPKTTCLCLNLSQWINLSLEEGNLQQSYRSGFKWQLGSQIFHVAGLSKSWWHLCQSQMPRAHGNKGNGGNNTGLQLENWFQTKKRFGIGIWKGKDCFPGRTCHLSWGFNQPYPKMTPSIIRAEGLNQTTTHNHYASIIGRVTDLGAGWIPMKIWRKWKTLFQTKLVCLLVELTSYKSVSHHIYGMTIPFTTITIINITGISAFNWKGKYQQRQFSSPWHPDDSSGVH